jgi:hypothetical protein
MNVTEKHLETITSFMQSILDQQTATLEAMRGLCRALECNSAANIVFARRLPNLTPHERASIEAEQKQIIAMLRNV